MRNFVVSVNGTKYQVSVEEVEFQGEAALSVNPALATVPTIASKEAPVANKETVEVKPVVNTVGGTELTAPMPGTVVKIVAKNGANVKKNDVIIVLESMKMENEIVASCDGVVTVNVAQGDNLNSGDIIAVIA